jgi:hypothetical protein
MQARCNKKAAGLTCQAAFLAILKMLQPLQLLGEGGAFNISVCSIS